jgi:hypothetical protein
MLKTVVGAYDLLEMVHSQEFLCMKESASSNPPTVQMYQLLIPPSHEVSECKTETTCQDLEQQEAYAELLLRATTKPAQKEIHQIHVIAASQETGFWIKTWQPMSWAWDNFEQLSSNSNQTDILKN